MILTIIYYNEGRRMGIEREGENEGWGRGKRWAMCSKWGMGSEGLGELRMRESEGRGGRRGKER